MPRTPTSGDTAVNNTRISALVNVAFYWHQTQPTTYNYIPLPAQPQFLYLLLTGSGFLFTIHVAPYFVYFQSPPLECKLPKNRSLFLLSYIFQECRILPHVRHLNKLLGQKVPSPLSSLALNRRHSHPPPTQRSTRLPTLHPARASTSQPGLFQVTEPLWLALPASPPARIPPLLALTPPCSSHRFR